MTDFSTEATVSSINIPDRALREARDEVEDSIGSATVNVEADRGPGGGRGSMFAGGVALGEELNDQTELLSEIHDELKKMAVSGGGGGGGGGLLGGSSGVAIGSLAAGGSGGLFGTLASKGKSGLTRGLKGASKGLGRRIPLLNTAIYGSELLGESSTKGRAGALGGFLGGTGGAIAGAKGGAAAGATIGSIVPGAGTAVGAGAGAIIGGVGGGILGDKAGRKISKTLTNKLSGLDLSPPKNLWPNLSAPSWPDIPEPDWPDLSEPDDLWPNLNPPGSGDGSGKDSENTKNIGSTPSGSQDTIPGTRGVTKEGSVAETDRPSGSQDTISGTRGVTRGGSVEKPESNAPTREMERMQSAWVASGLGNGGHVIPTGDGGRDRAGSRKDDSRETRDRRTDIAVNEVRAVMEGRALDDALRQLTDEIKEPLKKEILEELRRSMPNLY